MSRMIELTTRPPYCVVQRDRGKIRNMLLMSDSRRMRQMTDESIDRLENVCKSGTIQSPHQGGFIYPGTKWCGPGTIATNDSDLGIHVKEDICCRDHDNCPIYLSAGECRQGICNHSPFTRSHCDCDGAFRKCLQNVNSETANTIGAIFFNIIQVICFKERTPCSQWQSLQSNQLDGKVKDCDTPRSGSSSYAFKKSGRYIGTKVPNADILQSKEVFINHFLRKFGLL
ncbi:unnamed protein product [Callosobruchus maculatus]|uniref:Phospholipase A2 n=1 Tax=Callosobruchus maculatus TaxID=64391 RepID=A0A653D8W5_CALMS|nr:unnamed protein product [Callosobruchus maculatus]